MYNLNVPNMLDGQSVNADSIIDGNSVVLVHLA